MGVVTFKKTIRELFCLATRSFTKLEDGLNHIRALSVYVWAFFLKL